MGSLAPAGGFPSPWKVISSLSAKPSELAKMLGAESLTGMKSGKEALYNVFKALKKERQITSVVVAAYTCPDVAAAAARAGLEIFPADINPRTLEIDYAQINTMGLAVVLSNLYGMADDIKPFRETNSVIIDDACQSVLSMVNDKRIGLRDNTIGVMSFGRGKAIMGAGGGGIILPKNIELNIGHSKISNNRALLDFTKLYLSWILERPALYGIINKLPFLGLGETNCEVNFSLGSCSNVQLACVKVQLTNAKKIAKIHNDNASQWNAALYESGIIEPFIERGFRFNEGIVPNRYPILVPNEKTRDKIINKLNNVGLGASVSYPKALGSYRELEKKLTANKTPYADSVSRRIITLPVHKYVSPKHIARGAKIIKGNL